MVITALILVISYAPAAFSQSADSYSSTDGNLTINESNLWCFQSLQCLKSENPFENSNLDEVRLNDTTEKFVVEGKAKNEEMYAEYDGLTGSLIKSTVIQRNIHLPNKILVELTTGDFKDWTMVGNKRVIKNFSKNSIE
jgi:hypothetical protein